MPTDTKTWNGVDLWRLDDPKALKDLLNAEPQQEETVDKQVSEKRDESKDIQEELKDGGCQ
jgi:hypothetical protein